MHLTGTRRTETSTKKLPAKWVAAIFETMRVRYGDLWTVRMGLDPAEVKRHMEEWGKQLGQLTVAQVQHGMTWEDQYPPNVMQFKAHAKMLSLDNYLPDRCGVSGCTNGPVYPIETLKGVRVLRCARHYMDDADRYRKSATSEVFVQAMEVETQKQKEMGKQAYKKESLGMLKKFIGALR